MKKIQKRALGLVAAVALVFGSLWAVDTQAAQGLCFRCVYIWFNGTYCQADGNTGPECFDTPTGCHVVQGECNNLTIVTQ